LQGFVVGELDDVGLRLEERLVHVDLRVGVDRGIPDVEELDDLGLGELLDDALAGLLVPDQLTGNLLGGLRMEALTFFIVLMSG